MMSGFDKIEFTPPQGKAETVAVAKKRLINPISTTMAARKRKIRINRKALGISSSVLLILIVIGVLIAIPAMATYKSGLKTYREAKVIASAMKNQNIELADTEIDKTRTYLKETQKNLLVLAPLKFVPVVNWYYNDLDHLLNAGAHGLDSAEIVTTSIKPYEDVLGLKGKGSFTGGSAEDRIKTAVMTTGKIVPQIDKISEQLTLVRGEVDKIDPKHYPKFIFGNKVQNQLTTLRKTTDEATAMVNNSKPLIKVLPALLGEQEAKKYLVIFQNDKELRPTGGFITAFAVFRIDKGIIKLEKSEDIYKLDDSIPNKKKAPEAFLKYFKGVTVLNLRDSNVSPDFEESMKTFKSMYEAAGGRDDIDGIIGIDTTVLTSTIKILDDQVSAGGITFTSKTDPRCDCPQAIYELENTISRPVGYVKTQRKSLIGDLISAIMVKALSSSPKLYWGPLFQSMLAQSNEKHILYYLYDENAQKGIEGLNAAGQIKPFEGDYFHFNEANFSGAKVNIFMQETVDNAYDIKPDGTITKTVTVHFKNPYPPSDCNLERGGLCLNAEYRVWYRAYVPKGSELIDSKGSVSKVTTYEELGKTVFDGFTTVRTQGIGTLKLTYKLPFKAKDGVLPVLIQKQPGTYGYEYTNIVNGKTVGTFKLLTDKELKLNLNPH